MMNDPQRLARMNLDDARLGVHRFLEAGYRTKLQVRRCFWAVFPLALVPVSVVLAKKPAWDEILLGTIDSGRIPGEETPRMEPPSVIPSTAAVVCAAPIVIAAVMIAAAVATAISAAGARVTAGIGIPTTAGVGSRSRTIPTTAAPSHCFRGYEKRCHADGTSENEYFAQHSNIYRFVVDRLREVSFRVRVSS